MTRVQIAPLVLLAIFAFSVASVASASAEATLLAEWLIGGRQVSALTLVEGTGEVLFSDTSNGSDILCGGIGIGSVGPNGEGEVTEVLTLSGVQVTLTSPELCESQAVCEKSTTDVEVAPEQLPWHGSLYLTESGKFLTTLVEGNSAYDIACLVLGVRVTDECTTTGATFEVSNVTGGVTAAEESGVPLATCSIGGAGTGELVPLKGNLLTASGGLSVSSEP
jgi:hypothetical protein